ncbi:hypothetical protein LO772_05290 [Yinghuangia sp. ASG 101]|uniref:hypothetical protein n=1 Tax=Yinghuangia sp. ASG 101 TaxID=2896848 RepID=UPI001E4C04EE|nr:hypothetical protein [Yinghuangia sp. ASG 101]UGQ13039.1 hypothetical protein LO772_05290 [Yinghuangia sp. ASG 101]
MSSVTLDLVGPSEAPVPAAAGEVEGAPAPPTDDATGSTGAADAPNTHEPPDPGPPHTGGVSEETADAPASDTRPASARLRCATCGTLVFAETPIRDPRAGAAAVPPPDPADDRVDPAPAPTWRVPVHAGLPDPVDPFAARPCPGVGAAAEPQEDGLVAPDTAPAPPPTLLPLGLHWRDQPFSHVRA